MESQTEFNMTALLIAALLSAPPEGLIPDGKQAYAAHEFLIGPLAERCDVTWTGKSPTRRLREIVLTKAPVVVDGSAEIPLPLGSERVAHLFRYVELKGENLDTLSEVQLVPVRADTSMNRSTQTPNIYRLQLPSLKVADENTPQFALRLSGRAHVTSISFKPFGGGLPEQFDVAPFVNLGHDQSVVPVAISIDPTRALSIDGHSELKREKWFRYYAAPSQSPPEIEQFAADRNFFPGRQMFKFEPALVKGYSKNQPLLTEDTHRPGYADPAFFDRYKNKYYANVRPEFADVPFAMCFNDYPEFMSVPHTGRGTPLADKFLAAGELAARFIENQLEHSGRTASYWECKNESSIKAEWDHHFTRDDNGQPVDSWKQLADFHNAVADAVHERTPTINIGGPTSAWMQIQVNKFGLWNSQAQFMDQTKGHLDFYSHHFYEDASSLGAASKESSEYTNYLTGRLEAILDMFAAHMHGTDNIKPILITEFGGLNVGRSQADYWLRLRSYSAYLTRFMQRPQQFDMVVPFIFLESSWDPYNAHASFVPKTMEQHNRDEKDSWEPTPCAWYFDLWREFSGTRLNVKLNQSPENVTRLIETVAVRDGNQIHLAISNMSGRVINVSLNGLGEISSSIQRRLTYLDGEVSYREVTLPDAHDIPVEGEETTVVTVDLVDPEAIASTVQRRNFFSSETAIESHDIPDRGLLIAGPADRPKSATLIVGVQRNGGLQTPLHGSFNGHFFASTAAWPMNVENLFSEISIPLTPEWVEVSNRVIIKPQPGLTITSLKLVVE